MRYIMLMEHVQFEWDNNKNKLNMANHEIDFNDVMDVFLDDHRIVRQDKRKDYGESRYKAIGKLGPYVLSVIYTVRNDVTRIISARRASKNETKDYIHLQK